MAYKKPESALVVLYDEHHRVLLLQRMDDASFWQSVTGALEEGELPIETAYREVFEETGIDAKSLGLRINNHHKQNKYIDINLPLGTRILLFLARKLWYPCKGATLWCKNTPFI